jgi:hypothetical protein
MWLKVRLAVTTILVLIVSSSAYCDENSMRLFGAFGNVRYLKLSSGGESIKRTDLGVFASLGIGIAGVIASALEIGGLVNLVYAKSEYSGSDSPGTTI